MSALTGRVRQTLQFVTSWARPVLDEQAKKYLTLAEYNLYMKMHRSERQHHLRVLNDLLQSGHQNPSLLKAALLHDVGKTRFRFGLFQRVLVVVVKSVFPAWFELWGQAEPVGWKQPFVVSARHPEWSAEMGEAVHMEALAVELIRRHQAPIPDPPRTEADRLLVLLKAADDRS